MREWLSDALGACDLSPDHEELLMARGAKFDSFQRMQLVTWDTASSDAPSEEFQKRYGPRGEKLDGSLVAPLLCPQGKVLGIIARRGTWKTEFRVPEARWNPVLLGVSKNIEQIWENGVVWLVEGLFDLFAMEWVIPNTEVVLATGRARLSYNHLQFLRRFASFVYLVYDNDETGRKGSSRAIKDLRDVQIGCRDVAYIGGKDPGEIWEQGGRQALLDAFAHAIGGRDVVKVLGSNGSHSGADAPHHQGAPASPGYHR